MKQFLVLLLAFAAPFLAIDGKSDTLGYLNGPDQFASDFLKYAQNYIHSLEVRRIVFKQPGKWCIPTDLCIHAIQKRDDLGNGMVRTREILIFSTAYMKQPARVALVRTGKDLSLTPEAQLFQFHWPLPSQSETWYLVTDPAVLEFSFSKQGADLLTGYIQGSFEESARVIISESKHENVTEKTYQIYDPRELSLVHHARWEDLGPSFGREEFWIGEGRQLLPFVDFKSQLQVNILQFVDAGFSTAWFFLSRFGMWPEVQALSYQPLD